MMKQITSAALVAAAVLLAGPVSAQHLAATGEIAGRPSVVDGDTIDLQGVRIRLAGVDAPESSQFCNRTGGEPYRCGTEAARFLDEMLAGRTVFCRPTGRSYDRIVATCTVNGRDVGGAMVAAGWAIDVPKYSRGLYEREEIAARAAGLGIWQGDFDDPAEFRARKRNGGGW